MDHPQHKHLLQLDVQGTPQASIALDSARTKLHEWLASRLARSSRQGSRLS
ncbi:MAG: hypothetical protein RL722_1385 [Pseudomonadota bacterium]|jgi:hypothetical protein